MQFFISYCLKTCSVVLVIGFCSISSVFAQEESIPAEVVEWQTVAGELEKSGDLARAQAEYDKIIQAYPSTSYGLEAGAKTANLYIRQQQFSDLQPLTVLICANFQNQPRAFRTFSEMVEKCMYAEAYPEALAVCDEIQSRLSSNGRCILERGWRGMLYARQGDTQQAEQIKQALLMNSQIAASDFLDAMSNIGWGYHCAGQWDQAAAAYQKALERYPDHPQSVYLQYRIIKTMMDKDDRLAADSEMQILLATYKDREQTPGLAFNLANEYYNKGQYESAIAVYEKILAQFSDHELVPGVQDMEVKTFQMMAKQFRRQRRPEQAVAAYEALLNRFPDDEQIPTIRDAIVETYADAVDLTKARQALQTDIENCPHRRELLRMITRVAVDTARAGDTETAMQLVDAIFDQNPETADELLFGYTTLARVYVHQDKDAAAEATLNEAINLFADDPNALVYHLFGVGEEYYYGAQKADAAGHLAKAKTEYAKTIAALDTYMTLLSERHHRNRSMALYMKAVCCRRLEQWLPAAKAFGDSMQADPQYKSADYCLFAKAGCYQKLMLSGELSPMVAIPVIQKTYSELISNYPESQYTAEAKSWLQNN